MCDMARWAGRVALVTGASNGIGAAVASALVKHGMTVVGCSRRPEAIEELSTRLNAEPGVKGKLVALKCDVRNPDEIVNMFKIIAEKYGGVDVCVNNAGLNLDAPLLSGAVEDWQNMLATNILGPTVCTREAVKSMRERNIDDGYIFNVSSMAGHRMPTRDMLHMFYAVTKFGVTALTMGVRAELRHLKSRIRVTQLSPGPVETSLESKKRHKSSQVGEVLVRPTQQST